MKLEPKEKTIQTFRKHWFVIFVELILFAGITLFPIVVIMIWVNTSNMLIPPVGMVLSVLAIAWVLVMWIGFCIVYTDYYLDVWILTNQRLIDIEQKGLFWRDVATLRIEKIVDVRVTVSGLFPSMFGYGNVHIQSAGAEKEFSIYFVNNPQYVKDLILREQQRESNKVQRVSVV